MRVIKRGDEKTQITTCNVCNSDIEYSQSDCKFTQMTVERYGQRIEGYPIEMLKSREMIKFITCPVCGARHIIPTIDLIGAKISL